MRLLGERPARGVAVRSRQVEDAPRGAGGRAIEHAGNGSYPGRMPSIAEIRRRLAEHRPVLQSTAGRRQAAVAMVLRDLGPAPDVLFIERASHPADPWSGHMAFPGRPRGSRRSGSARGGRAGDARRGGGRALRRRAAGTPRRHERTPRRRRRLAADLRRSSTPPGASCRWRRTTRCARPSGSRSPSCSSPRASSSVRWLAREIFRFPGILVGEPERHVVWGLTYRFLESFFQRRGPPVS